MSTAWPLAEKRQARGVRAWAAAAQVTSRVPSTAIDYSDGTMLEAKQLLLAAAAFVEDARVYMKGQLVCGPIRDDVLWER